MIAFNKISINDADLSKAVYHALSCSTKVYTEVAVEINVETLISQRAWLLVRFLRSKNVTLLPMGRN